MEKINEIISMGALYLFVVIVMFCCFLTVDENEEHMTALNENDNIYVLS